MPPGAVQLAQLHMQRGDPAEAIGLLTQHLRRSGKDVDAMLALASILMSQGKLEQAEHHLARAAALSPGSAPAISNHAQALLSLDRSREAAVRYRESIALDQVFDTAYVGLSQCLLRIADLVGAVEAAREGARRCPRSPRVHGALSIALLAAGRAGEAVAAAREAIRLFGEHPYLLSALARALTYSDAATPEETAAAYARTGAALMAGARPPAPHTNSPDPDRRISVGYLSADFRDHSVASFIEPLLAHHDPASVRIVCYSSVPNPDAITARLRALVESRSGIWVDVSQVPHEALAGRIRADGIDIAIDLAGHSQGNRLPALTSRPAPVQVTYLGWPTTTGLRCIDWRIVDARTDPPGFESHSTERLARMPGCFLCYAPPPAAPAPVLDRSGPPVFGSLNALLKLNPTCVGAWCRVLNEVPGSRMVLKAAQLDIESQRQHVLSLFAAHGIGPDRLELIPRLDDPAAHLAVYNRIDIALDTLPYNGTTTTCEALWMGVPVLTIQGKAHAARVSNSILSAIGLGELAAPDADSFVRRALDLVADRPHLAELRSSLRDRMRSSPLCDGAAFTRDFEQTLRTMWRDWCATRGAAR